MDSTVFLSQLIGSYAIIVGLSMLVKRKMLMGVFHEIFTSRALSYILGVLILIVGLLIVLNHTLWGGLREAVITILGWLILAEGTTYLFLSKQRLAKAEAWLRDKRWYYGIALAYLVLGLFLAYSGFFAQ